MSSYGDCVASPVPDGAESAHGDGWNGDGPIRSGLPGADPGCDGGHSGCGNGGFTGVSRVVDTIWPLTFRDGIAAASMRLELVRCPVFMIYHPGTAKLAVTLNAAGCR